MAKRAKKELLINQNWGTCRWDCNSTQNFTWCGCDGLYFYFYFFKAPTEKSQMLRRHLFQFSFLNWKYNIQLRGIQKNIQIFKKNCSMYITSHTVISRVQSESHTLCVCCSPCFIFQVGYEICLVNACKSLFSLHHQNKTI